MAPHDRALARPERLRAIRLGLGLTQSEMGLWMGMGPGMKSFVSMIESGRQRAPKRYALLAYAYAQGARPPWLIPEGMAPLISQSRTNKPSADPLPGCDNLPESNDTTVS